VKTKTLCEMHALNRTDLGELIGSGSSGEVYLFPPGDRVLKVYRDETEWAVEISILAKMSESLYVPSVLDTCVTFDGMKCVIMKYHGRSISSLVRDGYLLGKEIVRGITKALASIHGHGVVHSDIKPDNVLVDGSSIVLCDFAYSESNGLMSVSGTPEYTSPEIKRGQGGSYSSDIWSLGCVVFELHTGYTLIDPRGDYESQLPRIEFKVKYSVKDSLLVDFILSCVRVNPTERETAESLLKSKYLTTR
jgi:serine/threonine protein kinase